MGTLPIRAATRPRPRVGACWALGLFSLVLGCSESDDTFALNTAIRVQIAGGGADVVPMLRSAEPLEEALESPDSFSLLRLELLRVKLAGARLDPDVVPERPQVLDAIEAELDAN